MPPSYIAIDRSDNGYVTASVPYRRRERPRDEGKRDRAGYPGGSQQRFFVRE
jgi:hypothetical protein